MVAIGALVNRPLTSMMWLRKSGIKGVGDLKGKTIATAGIPYQEAFLKTILARAKLTPEDVKTVNVGFGLLPALISGSAQAMLGGYSNVEGVDLRQRGKDPVVTPVDQLGVPTYDELVLVADARRLEEDPDEFRLFLAALERGTGAAVEKPGRRDLRGPGSQPRPRTETDPRRGRGDASPAGAAGAERLTPYGYMDPAEWTKFAGWMRDNGVDLLAARRRARCSATTTCRARSPNSAAPLRAAGG